MLKFILYGLRIRRPIWASDFHKAALERHKLNFKGAGMWSEIEHKYRQGVE